MDKINNKLDYRGRFAEMGRCRGPYTSTPPPPQPQLVANSKWITGDCHRNSHRKENSRRDGINGPRGRRSKLLRPETPTRTCSALKLRKLNQISVHNSLVVLLAVFLVIMPLLGFVELLGGVSPVHGVQLKLNENFLCDIQENTLVCDQSRYQFMPYFVERKFAHNRIDKLHLRCSRNSSWTLASFVRENKKFTLMDYNSYIAKRDLHELHIVECPIEERSLSQLAEILFSYNDQFRLKVLNVSGQVSMAETTSGNGLDNTHSSSIEQLDHFLRKNEAIVRNLHVLEVANVHHAPPATTSHSSAAIELVHLKHLRRLKLLNVVVESRSNGGSGGGMPGMGGGGSKSSINKSVRPLSSSTASAGDTGLVRLNSNLLELVLRNNSLMKSPCRTLLRNLTNLEQLDLSYNSLSGDQVENCFQLNSPGGEDDDDDNDDNITEDEELQGTVVGDEDVNGEQKVARRKKKGGRFGKLKVLHLNHNRIQLRNRRVFGTSQESLGQLEVLSLDHNDIDELSEISFAGLEHLLVLTLTGNRLTRIAEHSFRPLASLRQLAIDTNRLSGVATLFASNPKQPNQLLDLNLNGNQLTELPEGIENFLVRLKSLDLGSNRIANINGKQFHGLNDLLGLRLVDNQLTKISKTTFHFLTSLQIINLSANKINSIAPDAFQLNQQLQIVRLDQNQLSILPKNCFKPMTSLLWLNLSSNALNKFYLNELPNSVELLDLHSNKIYEIKNVKGPDYLENLRFLDLSHNHLPLLNEETIPNGLVEINVEDNFITFIEINTFANKNRLARVNLRNNLLTRLESKLFFHKINLNHDLELLLSTNPFDCDCSLEWLMILQEARPQNLQIIDLEEIACTSPIQRRRLTTTSTSASSTTTGSGRFNSEPVRNSSDLKANIRKLIEQSSTRIVDEHPQFLCKYENHCHTLCQCCDYEATCDCYMKCPLDCSCYYETTWQTNVVDCGQSNLTAVPPRIPVDATVLYLDGNDFLGYALGSPPSNPPSAGVNGASQATPQQHLFLGRNKLTILFLNHSRIEAISNATFYGLGHLRELHLEHNRIAQLSAGNEFEHLPNLERLYLHDNQIENIDTNTFRELRRLQVLTLRRNSLARLEPFTLLVPSVLSRFIIDGVLADLHVGNEFNCEFNCNEMEEAFRLSEINGPAQTEALATANTATTGGDVPRNVTKYFLLPKFFKSKRTNALKCATGGGGSSGKSSFVIRAFIERCEFVKEANQRLRLVNKSAAQGAQNAAFRDYLRRHYLWAGAEHLTGFAVTGTSVLVLLFCIILVVVFRQHIQLMVFTRCGIRLGVPRTGGGGSDRGNGGAGGSVQLTVRRQSNGQLDLEPLCDAWLLCNERDYAYIESFVVDVMDRMGYYMQITSDWEQLPSSVDVAQRTMLVISSSFLQIEWQNVAFRQALYTMLAKLESRGSIAQRLIVVVAVPTELLIGDAQLLKLIRNATMLQLGEKRFWPKVRFAMPDVLLPMSSSSSSRSPAGGGGGGGGGVSAVVGFNPGGNVANEASRNNWRRKLKRYADETGNELEQQYHEPHHPPAPQHQGPDHPPTLPPKPSILGGGMAADRSPDGTTTNGYDVLAMAASGDGAGSDRCSGEGSTTRGSSNENAGDDDGEDLGEGDHQQLGTIGNLHIQRPSSSSYSMSSSSLRNGIDNDQHNHQQRLQKIQARYQSHRGGGSGKQHYHGTATTMGSSGSQQAYFV